MAGTTGNGVTESRTYEPATGRLATILAGSNASPLPALSLAYAYWPDGAVKSRVDSARKRSETFTYDDGLSRLTGWHLTHAGATQDVSYHYDPIGNLDQIMTNYVVTETNTADPDAPARARDHGAAGKDERVHLRRARSPDLDAGSAGGLHRARPAEGDHDRRGDDNLSL